MYLTYMDSSRDDDDDNDDEGKRAVHLNHANKLLLAHTHKHTREEYLSLDVLPELSFVFRDDDDKCNRIIWATNI